MVRIAGDPGHRYSLAPHRRASTSDRTQGVVTAVYPTVASTATTSRPRDPAAPRTAPPSDAIFVFSSATVASVAEGDYVEVTGQVVEFNGLTELSVAAAGVTQLTDSFEPVQPIEEFVLPATDAEREPFEGMLVVPADRYVISDTYALGGWGTSAFGSIGLGLDGPLVQETDVALPGTAEFDTVAADNAARAVTLDDGVSNRTPTSAPVPYLTGNPDVRTGVGLEFAAPVIVDFRNNTWKLNPVSQVHRPTRRSTRQSSRTIGCRLRTRSRCRRTANRICGRLVQRAELLHDPRCDGNGCSSFDDRNGNRSPSTTARGTGHEEPGIRRTSSASRPRSSRRSMAWTRMWWGYGDRELRCGRWYPRCGPVHPGGRAERRRREHTWAFVPSAADLPPVTEMDVITNAIIYRPAAVQRIGEAHALGTESGDGEAFGNAREPIAQVFTPGAVDCRSCS